MVGGFGSEEQGCKPEWEIMKHCVVGCMGLQPLHDVLGMPIHHRVLEIESFQVGNSGGLYFLWEVKVAT
jgi:hypothetical protein